MFYGEFDYKLDDKGRVAVPPRFRDELKDGLVLSPGPEKCLTAYTLKEWKKIAEQLASSGISHAKMRKLNRAIFSTAFPTKLDNQGRIAIPAPLRDHAGIGEDVVIAGANNVLEIWDKALWEEEKDESQEQAWQIIETLETK